MKCLFNIFMSLIAAMIAFSANAYTVTLDFDNADAVFVAVDGELVAHNPGANTMTAQYLIEVGVNEGYAFTSFTDDRGVDHLQYNNQTTPVIIRENVSIGIGESQSNDGLTFTVTTKQLGLDRTIPLTVTVDKAAQVEMKIGSSAYFTSSSNRTIELTDGSNTIYYGPDDKYVLVSNTAIWTGLYRVTFNGRTLTMDNEFVYGAILPSTGAEMDIQVNEPQGDMMNFTATIDNPSQIKYFTRYPGDQDMTMIAGDNTYSFAAGDYFQVVCFKEALECKLDGTDVPVDNSNGVIRYRFSPSEGSTFVIRFEEGSTPPQGEEIQFTLNVDDITKLHYFTQEGSPEVELLGTLVNGRNVITCKAGTKFSVWPNYGEVPITVTIDGTPIERHPSINAYYFTPSDASVVNVLFNQSAPEDSYKVKVSFVNPDTEQFVIYAQINDADVALQQLIAGMDVATGSQVWLSYRRFDYVINDITVNGVSRGPNYTGAILFNVYADTEVVFDVTVPSKISILVDVDDAERVVAYTGAYYNPTNMDSTIELTTGVNQITILSNKGDIHFAPTEGNLLVDITDSTEATYLPDDEGLITITPINGTTYRVSSTAIEHNDLLAIYVDAPTLPDYEMLMSSTNRAIALNSGLNLVAFSAMYEPTLLFDFGSVWAYDNGHALAPTEGTVYSVDVADGHIVRIYTLGVAATHAVTLDIDPMASGHVTIMRDYCQTVDTGMQQELQNTIYAISATDGEVVLDVTVSTADNQSQSIAADEYGNYVVTIDRVMTINVKCTPASVADIVSDPNSTTEIFNLQGIRVTNPTPGIYIVRRGGKIAKVCISQ